MGELVVVVEEIGRYTAHVLVSRILSSESVKWGRSVSEDKKAVNFRHREDFSGVEFNIFYIFLSKFGFFFIQFSNGDA